MKEAARKRGREGQRERSWSSWVSIPDLDVDSGPRNAKEGGLGSHQSWAGILLVPDVGTAYTEECATGAPAYLDQPPNHRWKQVSVTLWTRAGPEPSNPPHTFKVIITAPHQPKPSHSSTRGRDRLLGLQWGHLDIYWSLSWDQLQTPCPPPPSWLNLPFLTPAPPTTAVCTRKKVKLNGTPCSFLWHLTKEERPSE